MKYNIDFSSVFKKEFKNLRKQGKDLSKLFFVVEILANGKKLDKKYKDHRLSNTKRYKNCRECHIEPDWLLVYRIDNNKLLLLLVETGSHSELFAK